MPQCYSCKSELNLPNGPISRTEECPSCRNDVKVCYNCKFYDSQSYNECRESMAERVTDKDRRNFCDYFSLNSGLKNEIADKKAEALSALDDLFKK